MRKRGRGRLSYQKEERGDRLLDIWQCNGKGRGGRKGSVFNNKKRNRFANLISTGKLNEGRLNTP